MAVARYELRALPEGKTIPCHGCGYPAVCRVSKHDGSGGKVSPICKHVWCRACGETHRDRLNERRPRG